MDAEVIALLGGLLFLLLALVGGGFTVKEILMPRIPTWARASCLVVGVALVVLSFVPLKSQPGPAADNGGDVTARLVESSPTSSDGVTLYEDSGEWVAPGQGIQVSGLRASARQETLGVGDQLLIEYRLENVGTSPVTFEETFIGVRAPGDRWADTGHENENVVLDPGGVLNIRHPVLLDTRGSWEFWPCYTLRPGGDCPDEWRSFPLAVQ